MLKILQARLQQYMNREPPDVQAAFRKRNHLHNIKVQDEEASAGVQNLEKWY